MDNLTAHKAVDYDQKVRQTIPFYDTIHAEVLRLVKLIKPEAKCWIDTGCGTGRLVEQALARFPATQFILADPSAAMLEQTRARFSKGDIDRLSVLPLVGSADLHLHIKKHAADVLTAIQCHHYLPRAERITALRACYEVLKAGGLFVTFENVAPRTPEGVRFGLAGWKSLLIEHAWTEQERRPTRRTIRTGVSSDYDRGAPGHVDTNGVQCSGAVLVLANAGGTLRDPVVAQASINLSRYSNLRYMIP